MHIRELDESTDTEGLRRCVIELQDFERELRPSMPEGTAMCDAYIDDTLRKCKRYDGRVYVAVAEEELVGYVSIYTKMVSEEIDDGPEEFGLIGDLVVLRRCRGLGYGNSLLQKAEDMARASGVTALRIGVLARNTVALDLYRSRGFEPLAIQLEKRLR